MLSMALSMNLNSVAVSWLFRGRFFRRILPFRVLSTKEPCSWHVQRATAQTARTRSCHFILLLAPVLLFRFRGYHTSSLIQLIIMYRYNICRHCLLKISEHVNGQYLAQNFSATFTSPSVPNLARSSSPSPQLADPHSGLGVPTRLGFGLPSSWA